MTNNNRILLVGNSQSILDYKYGSIIDSFDIIVRFNNFETKGYEEYVGTKTTILARRACDDIAYYDSDDLRSVLCFVTYCKWSHGMIHVAKYVQQHYGETCEIVSLLKCKEIGEKVGVDQPYNEWCSVGILTVALLTERFGRDRIILHGFDSNETHYFKKKPKDGCYHNWQKERQFLQNLNLTNLQETL